MRVNPEEIFGPISSVRRVGSYGEVLTRVNDSEYGSTAGIATRSLARARYFRQYVETGCAMINVPTAGTDNHVPFGGRKH